MERSHAAYFDQLGVRAAHAVSKSRTDIIRHTKRTENKNDQTLQSSYGQPLQSSVQHTRHHHPSPRDANASLDVVRCLFDVGGVYWSFWRQRHRSRNSACRCFCHRKCV